MYARANSILTPPACKILCLSIAVIALVFFLPAQQVFAADITVDGDCSLRHAIQAANADKARGGCAAGNGADTITLTAAGTKSGIIKLNKPLNEIKSDITINGGGFTIDGASSHRIFHIVPYARLAIRNLTLSNGLDSQGGAIYNYRGTLDVRDSTFRKNIANLDGGAIYTYHGNVEVRHSRFQKNRSKVDGGAIYSVAGKLVVRHSNFKGNAADADGGAINNYRGNVAVRHGSFRNNSAAAGGGAIHTYEGAVDVRGSNFNGNSASRGTALQTIDGSIALRNSPLGDNRNTAIYNQGGTVTID